jgi:MTH538 TIR-like domain (DUF1863)
VARRAFFSFHFERDYWRASQVRQMGIIEGNPPCSDNEWEQVKRGGEGAIRAWIDGQLEGKSCAIVLVGSETTTRRWVTYEIESAWNSGKGVFGIRVHNLKDRNGAQAMVGGNPFDNLHFIQQPTKLLSSIAALHYPPYADSRDVYSHIHDNLEQWIEGAIELRGDFTL